MSGYYELKEVDDEAHALATLDDPHVSTAMEIALERESRPSLIVIERPNGETLAHRGTLSPERAVHVAIQIAHALHAAHQAGVIHRNVRPKNVTLVHTAVDDAFVKLGGFGKAPKKKRDRFVPPEGAAKKTAGPHTDIFGVGACLDAMLGGAHEPSLARIIARATAENPKDRYASAGELESALRAWSNGRTGPARRDPAWYGLGALVAMGVGFMLFGRRDAPAQAPLVTEAHAATAAPPAMPAPAATPVSEPAPEEPPSEVATAAASAPPPPMANVPSIAVAPAKVERTYEAPAGTFYIDEPLRYTSAKDGEAWRVATTKKVAQCVDSVGTGDCALQSMSLHCTLDRHGVLHCSRVAGFDKAGTACATPQALEDCIGRAASGVIAHPKFAGADVQLAEMKYWIRRAH